MQTATQRTRFTSLIPSLVDEIAEYKGTNIENPGFCLYEEIDTEALQHLFESTDGPLTVQFEVDDTSITVEKTPEEEINVELNPL